MENLFNFSVKKIIIIDFLSAPTVLRILPSSIHEVYFIHWHYIFRSEFIVSK